LISIIRSILYSIAHWICYNLIPNS
jgi:hypothetical protein